MDPKVTFDNRGDAAFTKALKQRVNAYFEQSGLSRHHTPAMVFKTVVMLALYILPFVAMLIFGFPGWLNMLMYIIMGFGLSGIGMSVMHDANHFGYSSNQTVNRWVGLTIFLLGADAYNWKIKHNKLHHVYTNIYGSDEDINSRAILRFAFAAPLKPYHRYQHLYAWALYAMMSLSMIYGDVRKRRDYRKRGLTNISPKVFRRSMVWLIVSKILYYGAIFGLPLWLTNMPWWQILLGFFLMHLTAGFIMSLIFQMAHVVEGPEQTLPGTDHIIHHSLVRHQLKSAADFAKNNRLITWYVGGLNFQVIHHLFPKVCHVHYPAIAPIVEEVTKEFNMPYHVHKRLGNAFWSHYRVLKKLGREQVIV
jgi:linoleoyl-CoA desaturase